MPDIKTKDVVLGTIKTVDRSAMAGQRMKDAYVHAKNKAEQSVSSSESNSEKYAADRISEATAEFAHEAVHQADTLGLRIVRQTVSKPQTPPPQTASFAQNAQQPIRQLMGPVLLFHPMYLYQGRKRHRQSRPISATSNSNPHKRQNR